MRILLHTCCGPCSTYVAKRLSDRGHEVVGYFSNPNIHPYSEHQKRLEAALAWARAAEVPLLVEDNYDLSSWVAAVGRDLANRCKVCYDLRLIPAAEKAKSQGFDAFSTTLLISPYQKHEQIKRSGEEAAASTGITFYYEDSRPYFKETYQLSRDYELYRQNYCGCIFSEYERSQQRKKKG